VIVERIGSRRKEQADPGRVDRSGLAPLGQGLVEPFHRLEAPSPGQVDERGAFRLLDRFRLGQAPYAQVAGAYDGQERGYITLRRVAPVATEPYGVARVQERPDGQDRARLLHHPRHLEHALGIRLLDTALLPLRLLPRASRAAPLRPRPGHARHREGSEPRHHPEARRVGVNDGDVTRRQPCYEPGQGVLEAPIGAHEVEEQEVRA